MPEKYPVYLHLSSQELARIGLNPFDEDFEESEEMRRVPIPFRFNEALPKEGEIWINRKWQTKNRIVAVALNIYLAEWDIVFRALMPDGSEKLCTSSCFLDMFLNLYVKEEVYKKYTINVSADDELPEGMKWEYCILDQGGNLFAEGSFCKSKENAFTIAREIIDAEAGKQAGTV
jgi:hypothetical protein